MSLTNEGSANGFFMPVAPAYGGGYGNGNGFFGGDWAWILLLLLIGGNGWGWGGFGGGAGAMMGMDYGLYPWLNNSQHISDGFRDQQITTYLNSLQNSITTGFGDVQNALCSGFNQAEISANARQMADMQQLFGIQSALQQCCCENKAATADLKYTIATEECATRSSATANTQAILDKLCQLELAGKQDRINDLERQLSDAKFAASQANQNAFIQRGLTEEVDALYNRLSSCPVGTVPVFGNQPIWTCASNVANNNGCGCGCGA